MQLLELFNKTVPVRWLDTGSYDVMASFTTPNGQLINVDFEAASEDSYEISFAADTDTDDPESRYELTGLGEQYVILGTVLTAIRQFFHDRPHVNEVTFSAKGGNRAQVYERMIHRAFPHFEIDKHIASGLTYFTITRNGS